jgi:hypothetical protein
MTTATPVAAPAAPAVDNAAAPAAAPAAPAADEFADAFNTATAPAAAAPAADTPRLRPRRLLPRPPRRRHPAPAPAAETPAPAPAADTPAPAPGAGRGADDGRADGEDRCARILAQTRRPHRRPNPARRAHAAPAAPLYTAEETTQIEAYRKEWGDVAAGEALIRRQEYNQLAGYIFGQIGPILDELRGQVAPAATHTTYTQLKGLVSDYDDVRDPAWSGSTSSPPR